MIDLANRMLTFIEFMARHKTEGWKMLGGVLLAFTGVEALFADLGAFSRQAIQISWLCYAFPCLLLAYVGQGAYIAHNPGAYTNPFYNAVPPGMLYPSLVIAILAAIVASQAIITASFQVMGSNSKVEKMLTTSTAHVSNHETILLPADKSHSYFESFSRPAICSYCKLASHAGKCASCCDCQ